MGSVLGACVQVATQTSDACMNWRNNDQDSISDINFEPVARPANRTIFSAIIDQNEEAVQEFLHENPDCRTEVNSTDETPIHLACKLGYLNLVYILIQSDCDCNRVTSVGSPIHSIIRALNSRYITADDATILIQVLVQHGCELEQKDRGQKTALFLATELGLYPCVDVLIRLGANINTKEDNNFTPLYMASIRGDLDIVQLLLSYRGIIETSITDFWGRTALIAGLITITNMFKYGYIPIGNFYMQGLAPEEAKNVHRFNRIAIVESLLYSGCDTTIRDNHNRTAMAIAFVILRLDVLQQQNSLSNSMIQTVYAESNDGSFSVLQLHRNPFPGGPNQKDIFYTKLSPTFPPSSSGSQQSTSTVMEQPKDIESIYAPLVRLILLYGSTSSICDSEAKKYPEWMQQLIKDVEDFDQERGQKIRSSLQHACRVKIRKHMAHIRRLQFIQMLPLPPKLRDYVMLKFL